MKRILVFSGIIVGALVLLNAVVLVTGSKLVKSSTSEIQISSPVEKVVHEKRITLKEPENIKLTFVGDIMLDRYIRDKAENADRGYHHIFLDVKDLFLESDAVIANLEGSVTDYKSVTTYNQADPNHYRFTFDPEILSSFKAANIRILSLDNNHILDFGKDGLAKTQDHIAKSGLTSFGDPYNKDAVYTETINGLNIAFISYNEFLKPDSKTTIEKIREYEGKVDFTIVYPHWGVEYAETPRESDRALAHQFVDAGADLVVGAHPHIIQKKEIYNEAPIYYSLGNFVFDQYFSEDVRCGLILTLEITQDGVIENIDESFSHLEKDGSVTLRKCKSFVPSIK